MGVYQLGTAVTITETFSVLGTPTDPTTVTFVLQAPDGTDSTYVFGVDLEITNPDIGVYVFNPPVPTLPGVYVYTVVGTGTVEATGSGDFTITNSPTNPAEVTWAVDGPCTPWCDAQDIWVSCGSPTTEVIDGSNIDICPVNMFPYAMMASELLWWLSGRLYLGRCTRTVRPCGNTPCGFQVLSRGHIVWPDINNWGLNNWGWNGWGWNFPDYGGCGCVPLDRILLAGYPVREILTVKIDGVVLPEFDMATGTRNWRLDKRRYLVRMANSDGEAQRWPACQRMDEDDTEPGTFSVEYAYGQDPPMLGALAAAQVGCEFYRAANGDECSLPAGTVRIQRNGITIDKLAALGWYKQSSNRFGPQARWATGLPVVDAFLNGVNPFGLTRRPVMMAPGNRRPRYAQSVGQS